MLALVEKDIKPVQKLKATNDRYRINRVNSDKDVYHQNLVCVPQYQMQEICFHEPLSIKDM